MGESDKNTPIFDFRELLGGYSRLVSPMSLPVLPPAAPQPPIAAPASPKPAFLQDLVTFEPVPNAHQLSKLQLYRIRRERLVIADARARTYREQIDQVLENIERDLIATNKKIRELE